MKRRITAHGAHFLRSSETTIAQQSSFKVIQILTSVMAIAFALLLVFGLHFCLVPDSALADDVAKISTAEEDSPENSDESSDSEDDAEDPEGSDESEEGESSEEASSSSSPDEEGQDDQNQVGGLILYVVDSDIADDADVADGGLTAPQGDASFAGMKFNVYKKNGKLVKTMVVDAEGKAVLPTSDYLPLGTYTVKQVAETARERGYKANKTWAEKGKQVTIDMANGVVEVGTCACEVIRGAIWLNMVDSDMYDVLGIENTSQGGASLAEAEFEVYNASEEPVFLGGKLYEPYVEGDNNSNRLIMKLTTDQWGEATTDGYTGVYDDNRGLPWGTYLIKQTEISKGYYEDEEADEDDAWSDKVRVYGEDRFALDEPVRESVIRGGAKLQMVDAVTEDGKAQGDATFKGATFEVINDNGAEGTVVVDGTAYSEGDVVLKLTTNKEGLASSAKDVLPYGTYKVRMVNNKKYRSYVYDKDWEAIIKIKKDNKRAGIGKGKSFEAKVARGGVTLKQLDKESKEPVKGTKLEIVNASKKPVVVKGSTYEKDKVVLTFSSNDEGIAKTARSVLPYGTYILRESAAAPGYDLNKDLSEEFKIRKAKKIVNVGKVYETASPVLLETETNDGKSKGNAILPILGVLVVAAAAAGAVFYRRRRQQEQELLAALPGADAAVMAAGAASATTGNATGAFVGEEETEALANTGRMVAIDAEATRALIDDQATRAMQATLASRAAREGGPAHARSASSADTVALSDGVPQAQATQATSEPQGQKTPAHADVPLVPPAEQVAPAPQDVEATRAMRASLDAVTIPLVNAAHGKQPTQPDESKDPTQPNYLDKAFESLESEKPEDPTEPNRFDQAIEADQRTRVMPSAQAVQNTPDAQDFEETYEDDQEFGAILPAVVTKSEQKRARRANRWGKRQ